jgi:hypothetical protein
VPKKTPFTVIEGSQAPDTPLERTRRRLRASLPTELVRCPRCSGNAMLQIRIGMFWSNGKPVSGQKQLICAACHSKGEHVVISF